MERDCTTSPALLLVRPASFGFDEETALSNRFQERGSDEADSASLAREEFDKFLEGLRTAGITAIVKEDSPEPVKPSAVFPNNWISFHADGTVVLYPMATESRRLEVRPEWVEEIAAARGLRVRRVLDLRVGAPADAFLEGTGSLVLDRTARVAFAALSPRTDTDLVTRFASELGYEPLCFRAVDPGGVPIYHTNVMLSVGSSVALVCYESIPDLDERRRLAQRLETGQRIVLELTWEQVCAFAGNALEVDRPETRPALVLSERAKEALSEAQRRTLEGRIELVSTPLETIERLGGGSARCMVAAIHLPAVT